MPRRHAMPSAPERLRRVRELFDAVMDRPPDERTAFLASAAAWDIPTRREVQELVAAADQTGSVFAAALGSGTRHAEAQADGLVGKRLGPYEVVRVIGMGGMGAVYEGVRADQYRKRVAIKLVQGGLDSELTIARFRRERQILANLEHPNVATLLDGGVTPDGRPFLVMEYVEGDPITAWCDARRLSVSARLALFRQVCDAVQYAHKNLVVHGDIKPGNILVTADGTAKLLDFGIAKLLGTDAGDDALPLTRGDARPFTPEYASPEQIRGDALSTASDVYSLGAVLFELLAGRRPHVVTSRALVDIMRAVLEVPVPRPSSVVTADAAERRGERSAGRLRRQLQGELDNIALMALRSEPERRYASAGALSEDVRRELTGLPVEAHGDWAGYRLRKFVARNRTGVAASLLVVVALIGGVITTADQARRARAAQMRAERVNGFLRTLLSSVRPATGGRDVPVSDVLDSAGRRADIELASQPDVHAVLETVIGQSYLSLGRYADAEQHLRAALELHREVSGPRSEAVVLALRDLGSAAIYEDQMDRADSLFQQGLSIEQSISSTPDTILASLIDNLGSVAHGKGDFAAAERLHRQSLAIQTKLLGPNADIVAATMASVAVSLGEQNRMTESDSMLRHAVAILKHNHPEPNVLVANVLDPLATELDMEGKTAAADSAYVEVLDLRRQLLGPEHPDYTLTLMNYSFFVYDRGRYQEAADMSRQILALRGRVLPESHLAIASALQTLGRCLDKQSDTAGARRALEESLRLRRKYNAGSWIVASADGVLADHDVSVKQYAKAETLLDDANTILTSAVPPTHPKMQINYQRYAALYDAWGQPAKAAAYRAKLVTQPAGP
jgi:tRNA A-37 threonylcarbamoyl transferase component Bud32/tetratricopeptide (TPR) repeat protein